MFTWQVGGVSTAELNRLELEMLKLLDFKLMVQPEEVQLLLVHAQSPLLVLTLPQRWQYGSRKRRSTGMEGIEPMDCRRMHRRSMDTVVQPMVA